MDSIYFRIFITLLLFTPACINLNEDKSITLKNIVDQNLNMDSFVRIEFSDSINVREVFVDRKHCPLINEGGIKFVRVQLAAGEHLLLTITLHNESFNSVIKVKPGNKYSAFYSVLNDKSDPQQVDRNKKEKEKTFWETVEGIGGIVFVVLLVLIWGIFPLINILSNNKEAAILIIFAVVLLTLIAILFFGIRFIYLDWAPYLTLYLIFIPGFYGLLIGLLGSGDEGYRKDMLHEWRFVSPQGGTGARYKDASIKDVYEHSHGSGSWGKKIKNRKLYSPVFGLIIGIIALFIIDNSMNNTLLYLSLGFASTVFLGLINYTINYVLCWEKSTLRKVIFFTTILNIGGCIFTYLIL